MSAGTVGLDAPDNFSDGTPRGPMITDSQSLFSAKRMLRNVANESLECTCGGEPGADGGNSDRLLLGGRFSTSVRAR